MGNKKMGRPTDNPKTGIIKIRADEQTIEKLSECSERLNMSRSDIVRKGINDIYDSLDKK
ncbi:MAG: ribbon-helix-helix protein, CopG family [Oscillospiraceae bacterium]|nr:ribbon-helix-helix protein, CopG family [Oscillospiraceae bacterium]